MAELVAELSQTRLVYVADLDPDIRELMVRVPDTYNHHSPQPALGHITPVEALRHWAESLPGLFVSDVSNLPGLDS